MNDQKAQTEGKAGVQLRRQDLIDLGEVFKTALAPVGAIVDHMKAQNVTSADLLKQMEQQSARMGRLQRWVVLLTLTCAVLTTVSLLAAYQLTRLTAQTDDVSSHMTKTAHRLSTLAADVTKARASVEATREEVAVVSSAQAVATRVELVPETDPKKARRAPMRVRVVAPAKAPPKIDADSGKVEAAKHALSKSEEPAASPAVTAEFSVPVESFQ